MKSLWLLPLVLMMGCSTLVEVPRVPDSVAKMKPMDAWTAVLKKHVDEEGRVDFVAVQRDPGELLAYVNYVSKNGPKTTPKAFSTKSDRIAHYINAYNALSMYNIIDSDIPESLSGLSKVKFFYFKKFIIDGEEMSLYHYENEIIRKQGEERVHFALNCMSKGCPRLPRTPFTGKGLEAELDGEAKRFFNEARNVRVDTEEKTVYLSEILDFFTEDFLVKSPNLIHYANRYRTGKDKLPESFEVDFIDYDWTVNIQPGSRDSKVSNRLQRESGSKSDTQRAG